jgi:hypothetical protein
MGTKSILCLTWDVQKQTDGTFEDTLLNMHGIDGMTNLKLFLVGLVSEENRLLLKWRVLWRLITFLPLYPFHRLTKNNIDVLNHFKHKFAISMLWCRSILNHTIKN